MTLCSVYKGGECFLAPFAIIGVCMNTRGVLDGVFEK